MDNTNPSPAIGTGEPTHLVTYAVNGQWRSSVVCLPGGMTGSAYRELMDRLPAGTTAIGRWQELDADTDRPAPSDAVDRLRTAIACAVRELDDECADRQVIAEDLIRECRAVLRYLDRVPR